MLQATRSTTAPVPGGRRRKSRGRRGLAGFAFTLPFMGLFLAVFVAPLLYALYLSLFREQLIGGRSFVGLGNYAEGVTDEDFLSGVGRVVLFLVVQVPVMLVLALFFALALDSGRVRFAKFFRIGIFVPYAVPTVIAALMWGFLYGRDFGPLAEAAGKLGVSAPNFLGEHTMLWSIANVSTWTFTGVNMIVFLTALRAVPEELYDAAAVDGAGALRIALHVKLPLLRPALLLCTIFSVIGALQLFAEPQIFSAIAPQVIGKAFTPNLYVYNLAFTDQRLNYAAALSVLMGAVALIASVGVVLVFRRRGKPR
jgi:multiple sugar transport system permease protein